MCGLGDKPKDFWSTYTKIVADACNIAVALYIIENILLSFNMTLYKEITLFTECQ